MTYIGDKWLPKPNLSASQIKALQLCARMYFYERIAKLSVVTPFLIYGGAGHTGLELNYSQKITTGIDLPIDDVLNAAREEVNKTKHTITDWTGRPDSYFWSIIRAYLVAHMKHIAPTINPVSTEEYFRIEIAGVPLIGYIDITTDDGRILDHKFRFGYNPPPLDPETDIQLTIYSMAKNLPDAGFIMHWLDPSDKKVPHAVIRESMGTSRTMADYVKLRSKVKGIITDLGSYKDAGDFPKKIDIKQCPWFCKFKKLCFGSQADKVDVRVKEMLLEEFKPASKMLKGEVEDLKVDSSYTTVAELSDVLSKSEDVILERYGQSGNMFI